MSPRAKKAVLKAVELEIGDTLYIPVRDKEDAKGFLKEVRHAVRELADWDYNIAGALKPKIKYDKARFFITILKTAFDSDTGFVVQEEEGTSEKIKL